MHETKRILSDRCLEIDLYLSYVISLKNTSIDKTVFKILKANVLLMLYNCIEAVVSTSVDDIRNTIFNDTTASFDCLKNEIKIQIIKDLKKNVSPQDFTNSCTNVSKDIINLTFKKRAISNGNIDKDSIAAIAKTYGFTINASDYSQTAHGETLNKIRGKRNDLAHGTFSFAEIGKMYSPEDLTTIKERTVSYLEYMLKEIETYVHGKMYLQ